MKRRNARKSLSLGGQPSFNWQLQDDSQQSGNLSLYASHSQNSTRGRILLASCALFIVLVGAMIAQRLMLRAEENLAEVESEVAQAILHEHRQRQLDVIASKTISQSLASSIAGTEMDGSVTLLTLYGNLALVDLWVANPVESWYSEPYHVSRIMQQGATGWRLIPAVNTFWSERRTLETRYFHLDYSQRDENAVREVAPTLDDLYLQLHKDLGLPQPGRRKRVKIVIGVVEGSEVRVTDLRYSGNALIISPPELIPRPSRISDAETLRQAITFPLAVKIFEGAVDEYPIHCNWRSLSEGVGLWLRWEGHTLPSRRRWEYESVVQRWSNPKALPRLDDLLSIPHDCWQPPPFLEIEVLNSGRPIPRSELSATLVEYLVATHGRQVIPILLRDLTQFSSWNTLAYNVVNLSAEELEADWQAYLVAR